MEEAWSSGVAPQARGRGGMEIWSSEANCGSEDVEGWSSGGPKVRGFATGL